MKTLINREKRSKVPNEVKPVKNTNKNLQSFLKISSIQRDVSLSRKPQDYVYE